MASWECAADALPTLAMLVVLHVLLLVMVVVHPVPALVLIVVVEAVVGNKQPRLLSEDGETVGLMVGM